MIKLGLLITNKKDYQVNENLDTHSTSYQNLKTGVNKKIGHINEAIQYEELKSVTITCADKVKQILSAYDTKGEEQTLITSENKDQACDGYVCMYKCGNHSLHSTYEQDCTAKETYTSKIK